MSSSSSASPSPGAPRRLLRGPLTRVVDPLTPKKKLAKADSKTNGNYENVDSEEVKACHDNVERKRKRDDNTASETPEGKKARRYPALSNLFPLRNSLLSPNDALDDGNPGEPGHVSSTGRLAYMGMRGEQGCSSPVEDSITCRPLPGEEAQLLTMDSGELDEGDENDGDDDKTPGYHDIDAKAPKSPKCIEHPERIPGLKTLQQVIERAVGNFHRHWDPRFPKYHIEVDVKITERRVWTWKEDGKIMLRLNTRKNQ